MHRLEDIVNDRIREASALLSEAIQSGQPLRRSPERDRRADVFFVINHKCMLKCHFRHDFIQDFFFVLGNKVYQIVGTECMLLKRQPVISVLNDLSGEDVRLFPLFSEKRLRKLVSEIVDLDLLKSIYEEVRSKVTRVECDPDSEITFYVRTRDLEKIWLNVLENRREEIEHAEKRRAQQLKEEGLIWVRESKMVLTAVRAYLKRPTKKHLEVYQSRERVLKRVPILPIS